MTASRSALVTRRLVATAAVAIFGVAASVTMYQIGLKNERRIEELRLQERAGLYQQTLDADLGYATDSLYTLRSYFDSTDEPVTRSDFQAFVKQLRSRLVGLRNTGWAPRVTRAERDRFERQVRMQGFPDFEIRERNAAGQMVRAGDRPEYYPILFPDPVEITKQVLGFDINSERLRNDALRRARATGAPAATPPLNLITPAAPDGFMNFLPVYGKHWNHSENDLKGFVYGVFGTGPMIENILEAKTKPAGLDLYFYDPLRPAGSRLIYWHPSRSRAAPIPAPSEADMRSGPHWDGSVKVTDQTWGLLVAPAPEFARAQGWTPVIALVAGLTVTGLLVAYLASWLRRSLRQEQLTRGLEAANHDLLALSAAFDQAETGVLILDRDLKVRFINKWNRETWQITDDVVAANRTLPDMIRHANDTGLLRIAGGDVEAYIAQCVAEVDNPAAAPQSFTLSNGEVLRWQATRLPEGGWIVTYSRITELVRNAEQFEKLANTDALTGVSNRRHFFALAEAEWERLRRYGRPLSAMMLDIDKFKSVNDRFGHDVGDQVIIMVAEVCRKTMREGDVLARFGGEEFALLLPETDANGATIAAERIRQEVAAGAVDSAGVKVHVTVSVGVVQASAATANLHALINCADTALYAAKGNGRNCVVQWVGEAAPKAKLTTYGGTAVDGRPAATTAQAAG